MPYRTKGKRFGKELLVAVLETIHKDYSRNAGHDPVSFCEKAEPCLVEERTFGVSEKLEIGRTGKEAGIYGLSDTQKQILRRAKK